MALEQRPSQEKHISAHEKERIPKNFWGKIERLQNERQNYLCVGLDNPYRLLPAEYKELGEEEGIFQYNKEIIDSTWDFVCAFKPNLAFYSTSPESEKALERTIDYVHEQHPEIPVILDLKANDIGTTSEYWAETAFDRYNADAATVNGYVGKEALKPFTSRADKGIFVLCKTSNPGSDEFQDIKVDIDELTDDMDEYMQLARISGGGKVPFFMAVANRVSNYWNAENNNCALVVGATYPEQAEQIRGVDRRIHFLVPGIGRQGADAKKAVAASMNIVGGGIIINSSSGISFAKRESIGRGKKESVGEAARREAQNLRDEINYYRENPEGFTEAQKKLADILLDLEALKLGQFKLNLHEKNPTAPLSPNYFNQRDIRSEPNEIRQLVVDVLKELTEGLQFDSYADTPTAITPMVVLMSQNTDIPMLTPRGEKTHGTGSPVDGKFTPGKTIAIDVDDVITSGASAVDSIEKLRDAGIIVNDFIALVNREQGGIETIKHMGVTPHWAFDLSDLFHYYLRTGKIDDSTYRKNMNYLRSNR